MESPQSNGFTDCYLHSIVPAAGWIVHKPLKPSLAAMTRRTAGKIVAPRARSILSGNHPMRTAPHDNTERKHKQQSRLPDPGNRHCKSRSSLSKKQPCGTLMKGPSGKTVHIKADQLTRAQWHAYAQPFGHPAGPASVCANSLRRLRQPRRDLDSQAIPASGWARHDLAHAVCLCCMRIHPSYSAGTGPTGQLVCQTFATV